MKEKKKHKTIGKKGKSAMNEPTHKELNSLIALYKAGRFKELEMRAIFLSKKNSSSVYIFKILEETYRASGRLNDLLIVGQKLIELAPNDPEAYYKLGVTLQQMGHLYEAEKNYKKAVAIKSDVKEAHYNLGIVYQQLGQVTNAEKSYLNAIANDSDYAEAYSNLGNCLQELGKLEDAEKNYNKAIALNSNFADPHCNLGFTLHQLGRLDDAEESFKKAISIKPDFIEAYYNLGNCLQELGKLKEAEKFYKIAIEIKPDFAEAYCNLGLTFQALGQPDDAFVATINSLKIKPLFEARNHFVEISKALTPQAWDHALSQIVITALRQPWGRPSDCVQFACRLLKTNEQFSNFLDWSLNINKQNSLQDIPLNSISKNEFDFHALLNATLTSTLIPDITLEACLANIRRYLLKVTSSTSLQELHNVEVVDLYCSVAQQCYINEYVYFQSEEEISQSIRVRDLLTKSLQENQKTPAVWVITTACYFPLYSIKDSYKLLDQLWSDDIKNILVQQIQEPLEELSLRSSLPVMTSIENQVSMEVKSQYEDNPYPRWVRLPQDSNKKYLNSYMQSKFSSSGFRRLIDDRNLEVLIAGCGTGQHPIGVFQIIQCSKILAIDLSMASLAYAKRKSIELGIESIEYAQADILKLKNIGRTFDLIESSGVLHHLENPLEGWEVLLSILRPNGLMKLGFYSALARRDIERVRNLINRSCVGSSPKEIRNYRKYLLESKSFEDYGFATSSLDFFSTSACRDLLLHVEEHLFNLNMFDKFIKEHGLRFLGFEIDRSVIQSYKERFPADPSATNLELWQLYEEEYPDTFSGMYQFYVQKNDVHQ
jgi:tetratricopeptide (TPR) repeat protein/SAM-dependent methyltransferase